MNDDFFGFKLSDNVDEVDSQEEVMMANHKMAYFAIIQKFQALCVDLKSNANPDAANLKEMVDNIALLIKEDDRMLLGLVNAPYSYVCSEIEEDLFGILVIHSVNVMIYSLKIAIDIGVPDIRLPYIGVAALFYRLGLLDMDDDRLSLLVADKSLLKDIKQYEKNPDKYIDKVFIEEFHMDSVKQLISFIQEADVGLKDNAMQEAMYQYSMVIHICFEYEKLTHIMGYGKILSPVDAMKKLRTEMSDNFHPEIIKLLLNKLSIYPLGSFVKLSSSEVAKIVKINELSLLRPEVVIILDYDNEPKEVLVRLNLRQKPNIYIKNAISDEYLTKKYIDLF